MKIIKYLFFIPEDFDKWEFWLNMTISLIGICAGWVMVSRGLIQ